MIADHPYKILVIGGSGSGKANALLILEIHQPDIKDIYSLIKSLIKQDLNCQLTNKKVQV